MRTVKSCGPDAPTLASSGDNACALRLRWWQKSPVTRESTKDPVKTIAQGMLGDLGGPVVTNSYAFSFCMRGYGCIAHPAFPAPSIFEGGCFAKLGRFVPRECGGVSRHCEERKRRSNPTFVLAGADRWIASLTLAMTREPKSNGCLKFESEIRETAPLPQRERGKSAACIRMLRLQLPQQRVAAGDFDLAGGGLEVELLDHAVVHQHRVAVGADAEPVARGTELHADRLGEFGVAVGEEGGFVALVGVALPGVHHKGVIDRHDRDRAHALVLERVGVEENARQMHLVAGAGIGAGDGEQSDLLALEDVVGGFDLQTVRRHHAKLGLGQLVANFNGHRQFSLNVRMSLKPGGRRAQYCVARKRLTVIPGRYQRVRARRGPMTGSASNPESITTIVSMDSGSGPS